MPLQNSDNNSPPTQIITLPFPPIISAQDLIDKRSPERVTAKSPNAFFVYRKAFVNYLQVCNHNLKMRDVSAMAGLSWKAASREVKDAYKQIARDVERIVISQRRKKYEESRRNAFHDNGAIRPIYLESPYNVHNPTTFFPQQQQQSTPINSWFPAAVVNQHIQPRQETVYDTNSSQYNLSNAYLYQNFQPPVVTSSSSRIMETQQFVDEFLASQEVQNFTPINSAIDQFTTDYFNENDFINWPAQNNEEKQ